MKVIIAIIALLSVAMCATPLMSLQAVYHYEDPWISSHKPYCTGSREVPQQFPELKDRWACMPLAFGPDNDRCYQDAPLGNSASTSANFVDKDGKKRCYLECVYTGIYTNCGSPRTHCEKIPNTTFGACMYKKPKNSNDTIEKEE